MCEYMNLEKIIEDLKNEDVKIRKSAIEKLEGIKDEFIIDDLIIATTDDNAQVRFKAATILGNMGDIAFEKLIKEYEKSEGKNKRFLAFAIKETKNPKSIDYFVGAVEDEDFGVRKVAIRALGELQAEDKLDEISKGLQDEDWGVKLATIYALGDIATPESIELIKKARRNEKDEDFKKSCKKTLKKSEKLLKAKKNGQTIISTIPLSRIKEFEKTNLPKAINEYEKYITAKKVKDTPYKRLAIIYRKNNDPNNEIRVLNKAIEIFSKEKPEKAGYFQKRLDKIKSI